MLSKSLSRKKLHQAAPSQPPPNEEKMSNCHRCGKPVCFAERKVILGQDWHSHCLRCDNCDKPLTPGQHSAHHEKPYCNGCYQQLFGPEGYRPGSIEPKKVFKKTESGNVSAAEKQEMITKIHEYNLYKKYPRDKLCTKEVNGRIYFEGVLKIYWGLSRPITLAPGVMYSKNRNSRASIYDFYGVDDEAYLQMLEEAAKVRKRRELFEASEKMKLHEITKNAWGSKERMPRPDIHLSDVEPPNISLLPRPDGSTNPPGMLEQRKKGRERSGEPNDDGTDGSMSSKPLLIGTSIDPGVFDSRSPVRNRFRRISRVKKKEDEEERKDSKRQFTPPYGTPTNLRMHSAVKTKDVIIMLLAKFKVENDPSEFGLCIVHDNGFKEPLKEDISPLHQRLKLGPNEDIAKIYIMDASECQDVEVSSEKELKKLQDYSNLEPALRKKICDLEEDNSILKAKVYSEMQNTRREVEKAEQLKLSINQLQSKTDCLERQLSDSDEKVKVLKDTATNMLMRCRSLLGQTEAECPLPETECDLSSKLNEVMIEVQGQKCQNEIVKIQLKKAIGHLEEQLQWVNDEVIKFTSLMSKENDLLPFVPAGMNAPPNATKNIGRGAFGSVDLVEINGIHCAAKTIYGALVGGPEQEYVSSSQRKPIQDKFKQECLLICKTRHQNIVQFMGVYCHDKKNGNIVLFMEYLPIDLHNCLERFQCNDINIQTPMKLSILIDVCSGLLHIHNFSILHRDLTARNVLLTHHLNAKISDFGSSKRCNQSQKLTQAPGALPYMPPEAKSETPSYNTALDVFSFGVLTLFIAIQTFPELPMQFIDIPRDVRKRGEEELYVRRKWIARMSEGNPLHHIVLDCLQDSPSKRPFVKVLKTHLQELYKELSNETKDKAFEQMLLYIGGVLH